MELKKNQVIPLTITGMTADGSGVGRAAASDEGEHAAGMVVFVPFTAPGDQIDCRILKVLPHRAYGRVERLLVPSADRVAPAASEEASCDCEAFGKCGGCVYRHVRYEAELRYKWQRVADAVRRIAGIEREPEPIVPCNRPERYRNKAQYPVAPGPYRPLAGFYAPRSHRLIERHDCRLQPAVFREAVDTVIWWMKKTGLPAYDEKEGSGVLRHIYLRLAEATGEMMVCLVCTSGKLPDTRLLTSRLIEKVPGLASVTVNINREDTNVVLGPDTFTLWGKEAITDELCGLRFRLSPRSFYQVNRPQAEKLYSLAAQAAGLTGQETVLDLYCGTGTIGLSMAAHAGQVVGVETVEAAVEDARRNALENGISNARFLCADAGKAAVELLQEGVHPDVIILDPPRKGCDEAVIAAVSAMAPGRVVYVSCDPATMARDLKRFAEQGYQTGRIVPVDMFPRTAHVETVAVLSQQKR
ncbi:MAG: 23S rRNA (uracil(1939)-C(5))-methyltransferase RlmD [Clostridiales bacterium]|nr:23S rRNA (uracil(1939)-C(5))-methyltransferase RlmD [Clostridiales bacterium]